VVIPTFGELDRSLSALSLRVRLGKRGGKRKSGGGENSGYSRTACGKCYIEKEI